MTELPSPLPDDQELPASSEPPAADFNRQILLVTSLPPPESVARATAIRNQASFSLAKLLWLVTMVAVMLGVYYQVPRLAEEINYGLTRGRQRAEYENARERLKDLPLEGLSTAYQLVSQKVGPSVVHINVESKSPGDVAEEAANRFHRFRDFSGQGSGVIVDAEGYIVTNLHVVRGAEKIQVSLSDGRRVPGKLIGTDDETDIALIKVDAGQLLPADWGDSEQLNVGALVWAVGSPFGLERSVTAGILSAKHRAGLAGTPYQDFLQTDAAVNPGNSGGPLVNAQGQVVGINTAIVGESYQGISFAVPSSIAHEVYDRLRDKGRVARGWLGVQLAEVPPEISASLKLQPGRGAYIAGVVDQLDSSSPAQQAGIARGDVVVRWNDKDVTSPATLSNFVAQTEIGSTAKVQVNRGGQELSFDVKVGERPKP
jgi:S1-C subfamily serine protease